MLLGITSCKVPSLKKPITMYEVNLEFYEAGVGLKNLHIKTNHKTVGEWVDPGAVKFISLDEVPNLLKCFSQSDWDVIVVPKLKEGARAYRDYKD